MKSCRSKCQLSELVSAVKGVTSGLDHVKTAVGKTKMTDEEKHRNATCNKCKQKGHISRNCPNEAKDEEE